MLLAFQGNQGLKEKKELMEVREKKVTQEDVRRFVNGHASISYI